MHLSLAEIRRLITRLTNRRPVSIDHILHWSAWRRRRQQQARTSHYTRRGHPPPHPEQPSQQRPLQY
ncbi:hypothetical protein DCW30_15340 [Streptomyces alfalfae]|nr:hypothetical protein D3X13_30825 [Streptomyces fradiae]RXX43559.1 hypothetical protein DCW30_15340 [Streptomyces alfalfae]RZN01466.1 hypothetical protein D4104_07835 [Streptomyces alfalfae]